MVIQSFTDSLKIIPNFTNKIDLGNYLIKVEKDYLKNFSLGHIDILRLNIKYLLRYTIRYENKDDLRYMHKGQVRELFEAKDTLNISLMQGKIERKHITGKVLDFGAGFGGSSIFLALQDSKVTAIDKNKYLKKDLQKTGLFNRREIYQGDGIDYMLDHPNTYNLITAFCLGDWDTDLNFIKDFYQASRIALRKDGRILVTSDLLTMDKVRGVFGVREQNQVFANLMVYKED